MTINQIKQTANTYADRFLSAPEEFQVDFEQVQREWNCTGHELDIIISLSQSYVNAKQEQREILSRLNGRS